MFSAEHYLEPVHDWVCYSAPIRDPASGLALGVLDFSTTWQKHNPLGLTKTTALAHYIEARLQLLAPTPRSPNAERGGCSAALELALFGSLPYRLELGCRFDATEIGQRLERGDLIGALHL